MSQHRLALLVSVIVAAAGCRTLPWDLGDPGDGRDGGVGARDLAAADLSAREDLAEDPRDSALTDLLAPADSSMPPDLSAPPDSSSPVDSSAPSDSGDPNTDMATPGDLGSPVDLGPVADAGGFSCGTKSCNVGEQCCVVRANLGITYTCATTCPGGTIGHLSCDGPDSCGGNPCCFSTAGTGFGASCASAPTSCTPALQLNPYKLTTRLCNVDGDCTAGGVQTDLNRCCSISAFGFIGNVCLSARIAALLGGSCK